MIRTLLSALAAVAMLTVLTDAPAEAQGFKKRAGATADGAPSTSQRIRNTGRRPSANVSPATLLALAILRRKCLDNILPECPK